MILKYNLIKYSKVVMCNHRLSSAEYNNTCIQGCAVQAARLRTSDAANVTPDPMKDDHQRQDVKDEGDGLWRHGSDGTMRSRALWEHGMEKDPLTPSQGWLTHGYHGDG